MSQPTAPQQTRDQQRARHAMKTVDDVLAKFPPVAQGNKKTPHEKAKKFGGQARKLPTRIVASGLGQALAFLNAKDYAPDLLGALGEWVLSVVKPTGEVQIELTKPGTKREEELLKAVILGTSDYLRRATDEALAYLQWLNRFCEANDLSTETESA
jgi:CRISPR-associated protein Cmr5